MPTNRSPAAFPTMAPSVIETSGFDGSACDLCNPQGFPPCATYQNALRKIAGHIRDWVPLGRYAGVPAVGGHRVTQLSWLPAICAQLR